MFHNIIICILIFIFIGNISSQNSTVLFYQCMDRLPLIGSLCFKASHLSCYELTTEVMIGTKEIYKGNFSIPEMIIDYYNIESSKNATNYCYNSKLNLLIANDSYCRICLNTDQLDVNKTINLSGNVSVDCNTTMGHLNRTFNMSKVTIDNCLIFGCPNGCSGNGVCNDKGFCACNSSFFGPDCSIQLTDSYISSPSLPSKIYWDLKVETCEIVSLQVKDSNGTNIIDVKEKIYNLNEISLYPCQTSYDENCELCIKMYNLSIVNKDELHGCLEAKYRCLNKDLYNYKMGCRRLLISEKLSNCTIETTSSIITPTTSITSNNNAQTTISTQKSITTSITIDNNTNDSGLSTLSIAMIVSVIVILIIIIIVIIIVKTKKNNIDDEYKMVIQTMKKRKISDKL